MNEEYCGKCGTHIEEGWKLCPYCGKSLEVSESVFQPISTPESKFQKEKLKNKLWLIQVISGILTLISLIFPSAYSSFETPFAKVKVNTYIWIWGFVYSVKGFSFIEQEGFYVLSLFISSCILILVFALIWISKQFAEKRLSLRKVQVSWISIGISQIFLVMWWIIALEIIFPGIWAVYNFGFGIIGIFISAIISIFSGVIIGIFEIEIPKEKKEIIPKEKEEIIPKEKKKYKLKKTDYILFGLLALFTFLITLGIYNFFIGK